MRLNGRPRGTSLYEVNHYSLDVRVSCAAESCRNSRLSAVTIAAPNIPSAVADFMASKRDCEKCGREIPRGNRWAVGIHVIGQGAETPRA
jgi:hypothetical protein